MHTHTQNIYTHMWSNDTSKIMLTMIKTAIISGSGVIVFNQVTIDDDQFHVGECGMVFTM